MKKISIFVSLIVSIQLFAQPSIGITAGLNLPWQHIKSDDGEISYDIFPSFNAGCVADIPLSKNVSLQPSLLLSGKGDRHSGPGWNNTTSTIKHRFYYLELPLLINYAFAINKSKILVGAGPSLAWGVSGHDRLYTDNNLDFDFNAFDGYFKRFDAGIFCQAAFRKKAIQASAFCNLGITNIYNNDNPNITPGLPHLVWKNSVVGISLAYLFKL